MEQRGFEPRASALRIGLPANAKYLPFRKLQPPREIKGFPVLSHSLPSRIRRVLLFLPRIGHLELDLSLAISVADPRAIRENDIGAPHEVIPNLFGKANSFDRPINHRIEKIMGRLNSVIGL